MIKCLAIDDEPLALKQLETYIDKVPFLELSGCCQSAIEAHAIMRSTTVSDMVNMVQQAIRAKARSMMLTISLRGIMAATTIIAR